MEIFLNLTKRYINDRSKHMKEHWYTNSRLLKLYNPMRNKSRDACIDLLDGDSKFSIKVKDWLHEEVNENSLNIEDLRNWITHVKTHIIKLKGRIYYLVVFTTLALMFISGLAYIFKPIPLFQMIYQEENYRKLFQASFQI